MPNSKILGLLLFLLITALGDMILGSLVGAIIVSCNVFLAKSFVFGGALVYPNLQWMYIPKAIREQGTPTAATIIQINAASDIG